MHNFRANSCGKCQSVPASFLRLPTFALTADFCCCAQVPAFLVRSEIGGARYAPGVPKANQVGSADNILKQTLRLIHGPQSGSDRTDYRRSAKK